ncbi:MAG: hypothetical protein LBS31_09565, partial [Candidatus Adiutrix sp.]|nr:hypothetical protein [Candidatus Adiutrix sp.]
MCADAATAPHSPAEKLVQAVFRLPQLIKIHLSNNQLLIDSLTDFRDSVRDICAETGSANLRIYHGR